MLTERTNLYRVVAQTLQWIHGLTSMEYNIRHIRVARVKNNEETHHSFEVITNDIRLGRIKHPMGLVIERIHIAMTGVLADVPDWEEFEVGTKGIAVLEIEDMYPLFLRADNGGFSNVSVQTKFHLFDGGEESIARHFIYLNNMIYQIR